MFTLGITHHHHHTQHVNVKISGDIDQQDDTVMDNVIISCTICDEEALVDKACGCSGRGRRVVRCKGLITTEEPKQTDSALGV